MRSSAWLATSLRLVAGSVIFPPPVFSNVPPPPAHRRSISWRASLSGVRHSIPTICTCNQTPTVNQKNAEPVHYPWLRWRVFQRKFCALCIFASTAVQRQPTSSIHRSELVSLTRGLPGQVPLTPQGYGDLDPKEETIYQHSRVSCGCIEQRSKPTTTTSGFQALFKFSIPCLPKASSLTHI
jgi:hypothetical protein